MSRSSGPSKFESLTGYSWSADSNSGCIERSVTDLHRLAYSRHGLGGDLARARGTLEQTVAKLAGAGKDLRAPLPDRLQRFVDGPRQLLLHFDVAYFTASIAIFQICHLIHVGVEGIVVDEHRIAFDRARHVGAHALGIGIHLHD